MPEPMVRGKDTLMSDEMEEFIIDTIIIAKVKNEGKKSADQPLQETVYFGCRNSKRSGISSCKKPMLFTKIAAF